MVARTFTRWTRASLSIQVAFAVLLSIAAAVLVIGLAEQPRFRARVDLTESGRNSLDSQTVALLESLEEEVQVDLFFRAQTGALGPPLAEVQQRTRELLFVAGEAVPGSLDVTDHDLYSREGRAAADERMRELGVSVIQVMVISIGERRAVLGVDTDLATFDPGDPNPRSYRAPSVASYRGEEAFDEALARLLSERSPRVLFATGHGEYGIDPVPAAERQTLRAASLLGAELRGEGFDVGTWDPLRDGGVPADCDVLAIIGPDQPYPANHADAVAAFVERGGGLMVAVDDGLFMRDDALSELLARYGMGIQRGIVNAPVRNPLSGSLESGFEQCALLDVSEDRLSNGHPITAPLRERGRRLRLWRSRSFERLPAPAGAVLLDLVQTPENAWRDLPDDFGRWNFIYEPKREDRSPAHLALAAQISVDGSSAVDGGLGAADDDARIVAVGAASAFDDEFVTINLDFARNAFNWLVDRDLRIRVAERDPFEARIDTRRGTAFPVLSKVALFGLPGLCLALGCFVAWRRRR
ncbi:GldG family protein [Engelhardtia mirabilis]|uniref:ABC-type uncharacterized transport system n=1 Tax=Engelhardtia mirabilis TaxID=2528011 RepID=A0A518BJR5_9BACT|nr:ABC-type uncharacterized transport system [Planctomycetes bacterium Pla133]QDV01544.1 ABC-type uncharacterized transport system [Planctomycetes bacterium Pla86]